MGEVIESTRRHYIGDDADKDTIPAGGKAFGDSYHANDKGKQYYWNGAAWKTGLGYEYVQRLTGATDFVVGNFTVDGAWHVDGLNVSGIVPAGAVAVVLEYTIQGTAANLDGQIRRDAGNGLNRARLKTQVANILCPHVHAIVPCDTNRLLDYFFAVGITTIEVTVIGWFI